MKYESLRKWILIEAKKMKDSFFKNFQRTLVVGKKRNQFDT